MIYSQKALLGAALLFFSKGAIARKFCTVPCLLRDADIVLLQSLTTMAQTWKEDTAATPMAVWAETPTVAWAATVTWTWR